MKTPYAWQFIFNTVPINPYPATLLKDYTLYAIWLLLSCMTLISRMLWQFMLKIWKFWCPVQSGKGFSRRISQPGILCIKFSPEALLNLIKFFGSNNDLVCIYLFDCINSSIFRSNILQFTPQLSQRLQSSMMWHHVQW